MFFGESYATISMQRKSRRLFIASTGFMASGAYVYGSLVRELNAKPTFGRGINEGDRTKEPSTAMRRHSHLFPASPARRCCLSLGFLGSVLFAFVRCYSGGLGE